VSGLRRPPCSLRCLAMLRASCVPPGPLELRRDWSTPCGAATFPTAAATCAALDLRRWRSAIGSAPKPPRCGRPAAPPPTCSRPRRPRSARRSPSTSRSCRRSQAIMSYSAGSAFSGCTLLSTRIHSMTTLPVRKLAVPYQMTPLVSSAKKAAGRPSSSHRPSLHRPNRRGGKAPEQGWGSWVSISAAGSRERFHRSPRSSLCRLPRRCGHAIACGRAQRMR
jgi:hypothetical protein